MRERQNSVGGAREMRVGIPRGVAEPRSGRYAGCEHRIVAHCGNRWERHGLPIARHLEFETGDISWY